MTNRDQGQRPVRTWHIYGSLGTHMHAVPWSVYATCVCTVSPWGVERGYTHIVHVCVPPPMHIKKSPAPAPSSSSDYDYIHFALRERRGVRARENATPPLGDSTTTSTEDDDVLHGEQQSGVDDAEDDTEDDEDWGAKDDEHARWATHGARVRT